MSTLWTPDGERPVPPPKKEQNPPQENGASEPTTEEVRNAEASVEQLRKELLDAAAEDVVTNHCYGLFELAAIYLSATPPKLKDASLAIDALSAITEGLKGRLGMAEAEVQEALSQLKLAFVQISAIKEKPDEKA
ncbi:MAG: hypothetical protein HKL81_04945 [Acidimicrobiaceae bacterium]|nr:hypothetical protein [Acidimicrobiaceae bacterium]